MSADLWSMRTQIIDPRRLTPPPSKPPSLAASLAVPLLVLLLTAAAAALVLADVRSPVRAAVAGVFVLIAPGLAVLEAWGLLRNRLGPALVVAVSTSLASVVLLAQLYSGLWSTSATFLILVVATALGELVVCVRRLFPRAGAR